MERVDEQQIYIAHDENNEPFECVLVYSGKVSDKKPSWMRKVEEKSEKSKRMGNYEE